MNLKPLFQWWTHHASDGSAGGSTGAPPDRPLANWHRITGTKVGETEYNWVVDAVIYTNPGTVTNARIILRNPPVAEEQTYYTLKSQLLAASQQMTNDLRNYQTDTQAAQKAESRPQAVKTNRKRRVEPNNNAQKANQDKQAATAALNDEQQLAQAVQQAQQQFNAIPSANGRYRIDCFALVIGRNRDGQLIYDLGVVYPQSP